MSCSPEVRQRFLCNALPSPEQSDFELHLESCDECRQWLDVAWEAQAHGLLLRDRLEPSSEMPTWTPWDNDSELSAPPASYAMELSVLSPSDHPESLGRIGLFEARAIIGRGGMGTVFKAMDPTLGRTVAIKILRPDLASIGTARQRFALEARAMASIAHPHVVPIHAVDEHAGIPYLAMEYVPGGNLESRLQHDGALPILSVIRIAQQVASALGAAHECGLVHRDIKPANILLDRGVDRVRVADFGLVRVTDEASQTRSGLIAGTPQYMSPEQVKGESCDARSDLFALGAMMYALLAGHPPFRAETPYAAMLRIVHEAPRPLTEWRPEVPAWLQGFIGKLMEKRPDDRFASAAEVAHYLEVELAHFQNPSTSQPPPRAWMEVSTSASKSTPLQRWFTSPLARFGYSVAALAALAALTLSAAWWISGSSTRPLSAPVTQPDPGPIPRPRNPATERLLWSHDGYEELRQRFDALEQSETLAPMDPLSRWPQVWRSERWWSDAASLRNELEQAQEDGTN